MLNRTRDLLQNKANKPSRRARQPLDREGAEGDFVLTRLKEGVFIFFKGMGKWLKIFHSRTSLIPDKNKTFDLGSHLKRWKSLYLSKATIYMGDTKEQTARLDAIGTGEELKLRVRTPSGNIAPYASSNLQYIEGNVVLDNSAVFYNAIDGSSIASTGDLTIKNNSEFSVLSKDPSVEEEARINNRLRFDAEVAYSLGNIHNKFAYLKNEVAGMNTLYCNRLVAKLHEEHILTAEEAESLTQPRSRPVIGGIWSFDYTGHASGHEDLWTCSAAHGLSDDDRIMFTTAAALPLQFSLYKTYYVKVKSTTTVQLKEGSYGL